MRIIDVDAFRHALSKQEIPEDEAKGIRFALELMDEVAIELSPMGQTVIAAEVYMWQNGSRRKIEKCLAGEDEQDAEG